MFDKKIQMVDLGSQYERLKAEIDESIFNCIEASIFINGPLVKKFEKELKSYLNVNEVIACGNGTDALQIALMALGLKEGDEIIIPAFTYVATAEVIALLGFVPVLVDVNENSFNISFELIRAAITKKTKAIIPVHLFGQCADMEEILKIAKEYDLYVIEDNAQALGTSYDFLNGDTSHSGTIGDIGCTSFFPSKNLGCFGDGGAICTNDLDLAEKVRKIANHGQSVKYSHDVVGVNSRLDAIQAAILSVKLKHLNDFNFRRRSVADFYDSNLFEISGLQVPLRNSFSSHVFHQYTLKVAKGERDALRKYLIDNNIPSMIYYPKPLHHQNAYRSIIKISGSLTVSEELCKSVLSLPIHTEMRHDQLAYIVKTIKEFFHD